MTRARLIEKVIAEWLERNTDFIVYDQDGMAEARLDVSACSENSGVILINVAIFASDIDAEFDRIIRETSK